MNLSKHDAYLREWQSQEAAAERMLPLVGSLYRDKNVVTTVYGRSLVHCTAIDILKAHRFARHTLDNELSVARFPAPAGGHQPAGPGSGAHRPGQAGLPLLLRGRRPVRGGLRPPGAGPGQHRSRSHPGRAAGHRPLRVRPHRAPADPHPHREGRQRREVPAQGRGGAQRRRRRPRQARQPAAARFGARALQRHHHHRRGRERHHRQRQHDPHHLRGQPGERGLRPVRHPQRHPHRQYRQVAGPGRAGQAPPGRGHRPGPPDRPRQGGHPQRGGGRQRRPDLRPRAGLLRRQLHHQRHRAGAQGPQRPLRHHPRPHRDLPLLHQRPEPHRQLPQGLPPGPERAPEHGHHRDRRRQGGGQGHPGPGREAHRQRHPGAHPQRLPGHPQPGAGPAGRRRRDQRLPAGHVPGFAPPEPDRLHPLAGSGLQRFRRLPPRRRGGLPGDHRRRQPLRAVRSGTTTSSATAARWSGWSRRWPGWSCRCCPSRPGSPGRTARRDPRNRHAAGARPGWRGSWPRDPAPAPAPSRR